MDQEIQKKKWSTKKIATIIVAVIFTVFFILMAVRSRESTFNASNAHISFTNVKYDDFQDMISFRGTIEPRTTIQLNASEGGMIEEIFVEDGSMVNKDQELLRLSNPSLRLDFMNRETQIVEQINNLRSTRISLDQNKRQVQEQLIDISYQLKEQRRQYKIDSSLYKDGVIASNLFLASEARLDFLKKKKSLLDERLEVDEKYRQSQLSRIDMSVDMMERNLEAIRSNLKNLVLRAPISGQLNSFDHEIGQMKSKGENLGRIDILDDYIITAQVDQYHLNKIRDGLEATAEFSGQTHSLIVKKILPTVVNGQFEIHLHFTNDKLPANIRRGQSTQIRLELSARKKATLIKRGAWSQSNEGSHVYVVEGDDAFKRTVVFGSQNPEYVEIVSGLKEGEKVISSSYVQFGNAQKIVLK